jgi:hypothetical protein
MPYPVESSRDNEVTELKSRTLSSFRQGGEADCTPPLTIEFAGRIGNRECYQFWVVSFDADDAAIEREVSMIRKVKEVIRCSQTRGKPGRAVQDS